MMVSVIELQTVSFGSVTTVEPEIYFFGSFWHWRGVSIFWLQSFVLKHSVDESPNRQLMCDSSDCQSCHDFHFLFSSSRPFSFLLLPLYSWCQWRHEEPHFHSSWNIFNESRPTPSPPKFEAPTAKFLVCLRSHVSIDFVGTTLPLNITLCCGNAIWTAAFAFLIPLHRWQPGALCFRFVHLSVQFLWTWYLRNSLREFLQIWSKCPH